MTNLKQIEELLTHLTSDGFIEVQNLVNKQINSNRSLFEKAIVVGDIKTFDEYLDKVSFDNEYFKTLRRKIVPHVTILHHASKMNISQKFSLIDYEIFDTFHFLFQDILDLGEKKDFLNTLRNDSTKFSLSDILFTVLFHRLKLSFEFSSENPYPKFIFLKAILQKDSNLWQKTLNNFSEYCLEKINFQENSLLISELLNFLGKEKLFQAAKNNDNYSYLKSIVPPDNLYSENFMLSGLNKFHFPMVKECFDNGFEIFKNEAEYKNAYSKIFSSKESFELQEFIINHITDISSGKHIIIKTLLNKLESTYETDFERNDKRVELINHVITLYLDLDNERIFSLKSVLENRVDSHAKQLCEKYINFTLLEEKLPVKSNLIKKNKI